MNPEEPVTDEASDFEVRFGWGFRIFEAGFFAAVMAISLVTLVMTGVGVLNGDAGLIRALLSALGGSAGVLISIAGGKNALQLLFDRRPAVSVSEDGILNRTYWSATTVARWDEIVDVRRTGAGFVSEIVLADPEGFRSRQSLWIRIMMRATDLLGVGTLPVHLPQLAASEKDVTGRLLEALADRELAAVREQRRLESVGGAELPAGDSE